MGRSKASSPLTDDLFYKYISFASEFSFERQTFRSAIQVFRGQRIERKPRAQKVVPTTEQLTGGLLPPAKQFCYEPRSFIDCQLDQDDW